MGIIKASPTTDIDEIISTWLLYGGNYFIIFQSLHQTHLFTEQTLLLFSSREHPDHIWVYIYIYVPLCLEHHCTSPTSVPKLQSHLVGGLKGEERKEGEAGRETQGGRGWEGEGVRECGREREGGKEREGGRGWEGKCGRERVGGEVENVFIEMTVLADMSHSNNSPLGSSKCISRQIWCWVGIFKEQSDAGRKRLTQ